MLPFTSPRWGKYDYRYFYVASGGRTESEAGNHGDACITVESVGARNAPIATVPTDSICAKAAARKVALTR